MLSIAKQRAMRLRQSTVGQYINPNLNNNNQSDINFEKLNKSMIKKMTLENKIKKQQKAAYQKPERLIPIPKEVANVKSVIAQMIHDDGSQQEEKKKKNIHSNYLKKTSSKTGLEGIVVKPYVSKKVRRKAATPHFDNIAPIINNNTKRKNFIRNNKQLIEKNLSAERTDYRNRDADIPLDKDLHQSYGQIPQYLKDRQRELKEREAQRLQQELAERDNGLVLMTEEQRIEILNALEVKIKECEYQLIRLPIVVETPSLIKRKEDIESKIEELTAAKFKFSNPNVYIRRDI